MTTYVDVDTSAEAIQEDEELIEAVSQIVEKTNTLVKGGAEIILEDVKNDVFNVTDTVRQAIVGVFPFLVYWREDRSLFWEDMFRLGVVGLLFLFGFVVLAPSSLWNVKRSKSGLRLGGTSMDKRTASMDRFRYFRIWSKSSSSRSSESQERPPLERRRSFSDFYANRRGELDEEEETQEEAFAKRWSIILQEARYRNLVLPPQCKRVEKTKYNKTTITITQQAPDTTEQTETNNPDDSDNPFNRLVFYMRQLLHLTVSFLRYDYVGAGYQLFTWLDSCLKFRQNLLQNLDDDVDDDESDTGSVLSKQQNTISSEPSPRVGRLIRNKRDPVRILSSTTSHDQGDKDNKDEDPTNDSFDLPVHTALTSEEEKKDIDEEIDTPPSTPLGLRNRRDSFNSIYETPSRYTTDPSITPTLTSSDSSKDDNDLDDVLATKLALRFPTKTKDALENYRTSSSARKLPQGSVLEPKHSSTNEKVSSQSLLSGGFLPELPPSPFQLSQSESSGADGTYYFETVSTNESLRKMAIEVPVPDRNGYIVGDEFLIDHPDATPLLVFVNSRSGPQQGPLLIQQLRGLLNPVQVWDLANDGKPEDILSSFSKLTRLRILVCGGDGTVSWIVSTIEKMELQRWPPIAILPLGTGNDLARIHGWGGGYSNESLIEILEQVAESYISWLDRWELVVENKKGKIKSVKSFFNYFGVGADAQMALQVHKLREYSPQLFFSRFINKAWYGIFGAEDAIKPTSINLPQEITLIADGVEIPLPPDSQGIILLNIDSYGGGVPLWSRGSREHVERRSRSNLREPISLTRSKSLDANWLRKKGAVTSTSNDNGDNLSMTDCIDSDEDIASMALSEEEKFTRVTARDQPSSCQDGLLDVVSVRGSFHLGQIRVGLSTCQQLCQCHELSIVIKRKVSVQLDGEPWRQNACTLHIKRKKDAAIMLHKSADDSNMSEMSKLLDWAQERSHIDEQTHGLLMKEFSRRIESKTRERRVRTQQSAFTTLKRAMESSGNLGTGGPPGGIMF